jgi:hypothetical protein
MLCNNDKLFGDKMSILINGYCTSSTDEFNARMQVIFQNHQSRVKVVTFEDLFLSTEEMHNLLVNNQKWSGISDKKNESTYYFDRDCNYCGKHSHKEAEYWKKKQDNGEEAPEVHSGRWHGGRRSCGECFRGCQDDHCTGRFPGGGQYQEGG